MTEETAVQLARLSAIVERIEHRLENIENSTLKTEILQRMTRVETEVVEIVRDMDALTQSVGKLATLESLARLLGPKRLMAVAAALVAALGVAQIVINKVMG